MKSRLSVSTSLGLILTAVGWVVHGSSISNNAYATSNANFANGQIIQLQGEIQLLRSNGSTIQPTVGTQLYPGDSFLLQPNGTAILQCDDLTLQVVHPGQEETNNCPLAKKQSDCPVPGIINCPNRDGGLAWNDPSIPYLISPRRTDWLHNQPLTLRWNAVPGASRYQVRIRGENLDWSTEVNSTEVTYSGDTELLPDTYYLAIITTDTGKSSRQEELPNLGFKIISESEQAQVDTSVRELLAYETLNPEGQALALAHLYKKNNLQFAAIETLERTLNNGHRTAAIYRMLGELYQQIELTLQAEQAYLKALEFTRPENTARQATISENLGQLYAALKETQLAIEYFRKALVIYQTQGDSQWISELQNRILQLENILETQSM